MPSLKNFAQAYVDSGKMIAYMYLITLGIDKSTYWFLCKCKVAYDKKKTILSNKKLKPIRNKNRNNNLLRMIFKIKLVNQKTESPPCFSYFENEYS